MSCKMQEKSIRISCIQVITAILLRIGLSLLKIAFTISFSELNLSYVFCGFFLAAGNKILFKINRYPGEFGCKFKSVGGSPTRC